MSEAAHFGILGGGASGIACAIAIKQLKPDSNVTVYEKLAEPGHKILAAGNGRCNLSNTNMDISFYNGDSSILYHVLSPFGTEQCTRFFESIGLVTTEEDGRIYPLSMNAASVRTVLLNEADRLGVKFKTNFKVSSLESSSGHFVINGSENADIVIFALGGKAAAVHGTDGDGYRILRDLGIRYAPISPALVQLTTESRKAAGLKGVRFRGDISLYTQSGELVGRENGEILFTDYGLSGIAAMQLSGDASVLSKTEHPTASLDLCTAMTQAELRLYLADRREALSMRPATELLPGILNEKIAAAVMKDAGISSDLLAGMLEDEELDKLADCIKHFDFTITGTKGFKDAQVTRGGVSAEELKDGSLQSIKIPGLFFCGEILNADGVCGGYNLHFAWGSGIQAAKEAVQYASHNRD